MNELLRKIGLAVLEHAEGHGVLPDVVRVDVLLQHRLEVLCNVISGALIGRGEVDMAHRVRKLADVPVYDGHGPQKLYLPDLQ